MPKAAPMAAPMEAVAALRASLGARAVALALGAGVLVRIGQYACARSMWRDEAALAVSLLERSYAELTQPLAYAQEAPLGFLWLEKLMLELFGAHELVLRALPLVVSFAGLWLLATAARTLLPAWYAAGAVVLASLSSRLVYHASDAKQYAFDVLAASLAVFVFARWPERPARGLRVLAALGGAALVWLSHAAAFVLAGVGIALVLRRPAALASIAVLASVWLASFVATVGLAVARTIDNPVMQAWWAPHFMPIWPETRSELAWYPRHVAGIFSATLGVYSLGLVVLAATLTCAGLVALWRRDRALTALVAAPAILALAASAAHLYPFSDRLLLFLAPLVALAIAFGAAALAQRWRWLGPALFGVLLVGQARGLALELPLSYGEARPPLAAMARELTPGDVVLVHASLAETFDYYRRALKVEGRGAEIVQLDVEPDRAALARHLRARRRVFVAVSTTAGPSRGDPQALLALLDEVGKEAGRWPAQGAFVVRYELRGAP